MKEYNQLIETLIGVFTADKGKIRILLTRKKTEPYKGYWVLPGDILSDDETLENNITDVVYDKLGLLDLYIEQGHVFSDINRNPNGRVIATTFVGLIDSITLMVKKEDREDVEMAWFDINEIPKLGYDHEVIVIKLIEILKRRIINSNILQILFPSDFTLPELQKIYEHILDIKLDRRNFRKKLINLGYIVDTNDVQGGETGRPAKLYRFREDAKEKQLF